MLEAFRGYHNEELTGEANSSLICGWPSLWTSLQERPHLWVGNSDGRLVQQVELTMLESFLPEKFESSCTAVCLYEPPN